MYMQLKHLPPLVTKFSGTTTSRILPESVLNIVTCFKYFIFIYITFD